MPIFNFDGNNSINNYTIKKLKRYCKIDHSFLFFDYSNIHFAIDFELVALAGATLTRGMYSMAVMRERGH